MSSNLCKCSQFTRVPVMHTSTRASTCLTACTLSGYLPPHDMILRTLLNALDTSLCPLIATAILTEFLSRTSSAET